MHSTTIQADAGDQLDRRAKQRARDHGESYGDALRAVLRQDPALSECYRYGDSSSVRSYADNLPPARKRMAELQADPELARRLASYCVDALARRRLVNIGPGVPDSLDEYRRALNDVRQQNPSLAVCERSGFVASDDWQLLAMLIPSVAGAVAKGEYSHSDRCPKCGDNRIRCNARKLARQRRVLEDNVREFSQCIRDARISGNGLDEIACFYN